jgi:hypothetical protein
MIASSPIKALTPKERQSSARIFRPDEFLLSNIPTPLSARIFHAIDRVIYSQRKQRGADGSLFAISVA